MKSDHVFWSNKSMRALIFCRMEKDQVFWSNGRAQIKETNQRDPNFCPNDRA